MCASMFLTASGCTRAPVFYRQGVPYVGVCFNEVNRAKLCPRAAQHVLVMFQAEDM